MAASGTVLASTSPVLPRTVTKPSEQPAAATLEPAPTTADEALTWACEQCTLINPIRALMCDACTATAPSWVLDFVHNQP